MANEEVLLPVILPLADEAGKTIEPCKVNELELKTKVPVVCANKLVQIKLAPSVKLPPVWFKLNVCRLRVVALV